LQRLGSQKPDYFTTLPDCITWQKATRENCAFHSKAVCCFAKRHKDLNYHLFIAEPPFIWRTVCCMQQRRPTVCYAHSRCGPLSNYFDHLLWLAHYHKNS